MSARSVILAPRAAEEIDQAAAWWAERNAPTIIDDAVALALRFIQVFPEASPLVKSRGRWTKVRRAAVEPLGYNLFYSYDPKSGTVLVRTFRHQHRRPPRL